VTPGEIQRALNDYRRFKVVRDAHIRACDETIEILSRYFDNLVFETFKKQREEEAEGK